MTVLLLAAAIGSLLVAGARSSLNVDWSIPPDRRSYDPLVGTVGDTVRFEYDAGHNVVLHPTGTCDDDGGDYLGSTSPTEFTFERAGVYTFACDVGSGSHCSMGQIINVTISGSALSPGENEDGGGDKPDVDEGGEVPIEGGLIPVEEEDPEEVLERYSEFFNEGEERYLLDFRIKPYKIPLEVTTYVDFFFNLPEDMGEVVHIVTGDVIVSQPKHLHHFVLTGCTDPVDPANEGLPLDIYRRDCSIPLAVWAVGGDFLGNISPDSGKAFGAAFDIRALKLNVHYTDGLDPDPGSPNNGAQAIATDGIRILYTPNLRPRTVLSKALISVGSGPYQMNLPPGSPRQFFTKACTVESACQDTSDEQLMDLGFSCGDIEGGCAGDDALFLQILCPVTCGACDARSVADNKRNAGEDSDPGGYQVSAIKYHAHLLGREMYTTLLPSERSDVPIDLESKESWIYDYQVSYPLPSQNLQVYPGDKIQATCVYDSTSREETTYFDLSTYDEMCITILNVLVDTPDVSAAGSVSLLAMLYLQSFNCAVDDNSDIWGGSLEADEDARDIWKDHPMLEADCTFPVGTADGLGLSLLGDTAPTYEARCDTPSTPTSFNSMCDGSDILNKAAIAGESCQGGSMDGANSNKPSSFKTEGEATFEELCTAQGGSNTPYTCKEVETVVLNGPLAAVYGPENLENLRVYIFQPKCCTTGAPQEQESTIDGANDGSGNDPGSDVTTVAPQEQDISTDGANDGSGNDPGSEVTTVAPQEQDGTSDGSTDGLGEEDPETSGSFSESPSLLFLLSVVSCFFVTL